MKKPIPHFVSEAEERRFWKTHDSTEYVDYSKGQRMTPPDPTLAAIREVLAHTEGKAWKSAFFECDHIVTLLTRLDAAERELNEWKRFGTPLYMRAVHNRMTKAEDKLDDAEQVVAVARPLATKGICSAGKDCQEYACLLFVALAAWDTQKKKPSKEGENK